MFSFSGGLLMSCVCQGRKVKINSKIRGVRHTKKNNTLLLGSKYRSSYAQVVTSPLPGCYYQIYLKHKFVTSALFLSSPHIHHEVLLKPGWVHTGLTSFPVRPKGKRVLAPQIFCPPPQQKIPKDKVYSSAPWQVYNACRRKRFGRTAQCAEWLQEAGWYLGLLLVDLDNMGSNSFWQKREQDFPQPGNVPFPYLKLQ